jgi:hypothetical protein
MVRFLISLWCGGLAIASIFWIGEALRDYKKSPLWSLAATLGFAWFGLEMAAIAFHTGGPLARLFIWAN